MATYLDLIKKLTKPDATRFVARPSSMPELVMSFRNDPVVQRLLKAGRRAAPVICRELRKGGAAMPPLARACLFWILCQTAPDMAAHLAAFALAGPTEDSVVLTGALAEGWVPGGLPAPAKRGGLELGDSNPAGVLASIFSPRDRRTGLPVALDIWFENYAIPGITNSFGDPARFLWKVPGKEDGTTDGNWCTAQFPAEDYPWFVGEWQFNKDTPPFAPFLGQNCKYFHLDGTSWEWLGPTATYYCAGLIWLPRRLFTPYVLLLTLYKDCLEVIDDAVRPGDIVVWGHDFQDETGMWQHGGSHWGVVWKVAPVGTKALYQVEHAWFDGLGGMSYVAQREYQSRVLEVRSKLSQHLQEAIHSPYDQALFYYYDWKPDYFRLKFLRRQRPLGGNVIDLWIKTHPDDNGEMYSQDAFWESPDIKVAEGPFPLPEVVSDQDWYNQANCIETQLIYGRTYRIWAKVRNRGDRDLDGTRPPEGYPWEWEDQSKHWFGKAYIRYYWAYSGCPQREDWNIIRPPSCPPIGGGTPHFGPFTVPRRAGCDGNQPVDAPYAEWRPPTLRDPSTGLGLVRSHLCFLAIVYSICTCPEDQGDTCRGRQGYPAGDDPKNRCNPDPIVYPWEPAWDNNIAMRNVSIVDLGPGQVITLSRLLGTPHDLETIEGALETVISHRFETARQGMTEDPAPLDVFLRMGGDSEITTSINEYKEKGILFLPNDNKGLEKHLGGVVLPYNLPGGKRTQFFDVKIRAPKKAKPGSVYYVRIAQNLDGRIVSGCTIVVRIV